MTATHDFRALEREAAERRRRLASTLDDLTNNLTPGRLIDEVLTYSRGGGASFMKGLGSAASANPLPTVLIGLGAIMFLTGKGGLSSVADSVGSAVRWATGGDRPGERAASDYRPASHGAGGAVDWIKDEASGIGRAATGAASAVGDRIARASSAVGSAASELGGAASGAAEDIGDLAREAAKGIASAASATGEAFDAALSEGARLGHEGLRLADRLRRRAGDFIEEQPLIAAAAGLAIGAVVAALLPNTKIEDELLGETSDAVKEAAGEVAQEQVDKVATVAEHVVDEVKKTAADQGLDPATANKTVADLGEKAKALIGSGIEAVSDAVDAATTSKDRA
ncbi:MAG TPA: DUF3618 domain-containing protein [Bauldia sp.]|nr:DUF3618 domain-containing protein [Bauldia sp.]